MSLLGWFVGTTLKYPPNPNLVTKWGLVGGEIEFEAIDSWR